MQYVNKSVDFFPTVSQFAFVSAIGFEVFYTIKLYTCNLTQK